MNIPVPWILWDRNPHLDGCFFFFVGGCGYPENSLGWLGQDGQGQLGKLRARSWLFLKVPVRCVLNEPPVLLESWCLSEIMLVLVYDLLNALIMLIFFTSKWTLFSWIEHDIKWCFLLLFFLLGVCNEVKLTCKDVLCPCNLQVESGNLCTTVEFCLVAVLKLTNGPFKHGNWDFVW